MLLDEPTAFLDLPNRVEIMRVLRALTRTTGRAVLLSTHDLDLALRSADRIWLLPQGGSLHTGAPEDLVLDGSFEAAFTRDGVIFDRLTGTFTIVTPAREPVMVVGNGLAAVWTKRALEREGFSVCSEGDRAVAWVDIVVENNTTRWRCSIGHTIQEHASIAELVTGLRHRDT